MRLFIPGKPKGKGRPRFYKGHAVTPEDTRAYEQAIQMLYKAKYHARKLYGAIEFDIKVYCIVPKNYSKKRRYEIAKNEERPQVKPDVDNIAKIVLDALNGIAYDDDKQVTDLIVRRRYTFDSRREGVMITFEEV